MFLVISDQYTSIDREKKGKTLAFKKNSNKQNTVIKLFKFQLLFFNYNKFKL